ncbi:MAG: hypothetical protein COW05_08955 [Gammaproteobacteria bacterium CG12_big_fil_rev_8_21_14_0_65_46_12]|nr:MAG: hypothetical protein COW05_08955 [Gammaproteobacteria bacterium CG12_big_fil_rev_8_21_14_0_65_46_12]PIR38158.1 MAG: hypothetical protein COV35_07050 [Alphaproteobacteria bacterium CG11_big_fil_rev_8_21_14_0_20_39_49]
MQSQQSELTQRKNLINTLYEQIYLLKHGKFGASSERYVDEHPQGRLFDEADLSTETQAEIEAADESITIPEHQRKKRGRKPLPKDLPRLEVIHDLADGDKQCACGCQLTCIGDERTEQLEIIPAKMQVLVHVQKKYACKGCEETIKTADKPKQPIPKSIAAPGLLAHVLTQKYQYHLPLYRQEMMFQGIGVDIPRATLSLWVIRCSELLQPLVNLLEDEILSYDIAYADESTVQVLKEPDKPAQSKSYMWCFGGGPPDRFSVVYHYHPSRTHQKAIDFFEGYRGYLHCDGYQAYDKVKKENSEDITLVGCWYHARRKFVEAEKVSKKPGLAKYIIKEIQHLAKVEKAIQAEQLKPEAAKRYRIEKALPTIKKIKLKLDDHHDKVSSQSKLGQAMTYTLNQWPKLLTYLDDGRLEISNNRMERAIKPFAVGRKNWLFANSVAGAKAGAIIYSLIETCKAHSINPYDWLRHALTELPSCETVAQFEGLLPFNFKDQKK